jgi:transposase
MSPKGRKALSSAKIGAIVALHKEGMSFKSISDRLHVTKSTAHFWVTRAKATPSEECPTPKIRPGRATKTSKLTDDLIKRVVMKQPTISAREIKMAHIDLLKDVSIRTIQHRLQKDLHMPARCPAKKPLLTSKMRAKRLQFCNKHKDWTAADWEKVMFSDESNFKTFNSRPSTVRRPPGSNRMDPKYTVKTVKHPPGVMVWGCFSFKGRGGLYFLPKSVTMNSDRYINMLNEHLLKFMRIFGTSVFQQDGAPCHTSKKSMEWLKNNNIAVLDWPGNSPDLNPIENMWNYMKNKLQGRDTGSIPKLQAEIQKIWCTEITPAYCEQLCNSMPNRIKQVIVAKGEMTKY